MPDMAEFTGKRVVITGGDQLIALVGEGIGLMDVDQPSQLNQRLRVVLNPQLKLRLPRLTLPRHHQDRHRLAAADVPALRFGRVERRQKPPVKWPAARLIRLKHCRPDAL